MSECREVFAERIKELRKRLEMTQDEMATKIGITRQSLSLYEKGERIPDIVVLRRICDATNCSPNYLLGLSESTVDYYADAMNRFGIDEDAVAYMENEIKQRSLETTVNIVFHNRNFWRLLENMSFSIGKDELDPDYPDYIEFQCSKMMVAIVGEVRLAFKLKNELADKNTRESKKEWLKQKYEDLLHLMANY